MSEIVVPIDKLVGFVREADLFAEIADWHDTRAKMLREQARHAKTKRLQACYTGEALAHEYSAIALRSGTWRQEHGGEGQ